MRRFLVAFTAGLVPAFILMLSVQTSQAGSATWKTSPSTGDWNTANNWSPETVPGGDFSGVDTATLAASNTTAISLSSDINVNDIVFTAGASAFTITVSPGSVLYFDGDVNTVGITNNSGMIQNFVSAGNAGNQSAILFAHSATAGSLTTFTTVGFGQFEFTNTATAGNGTFINNGGTVSGGGHGFTTFFANSNAGNGTFINNGGVSGSFGGSMIFFERSTAGSATLVANGGPATDPSAAGSISFGQFSKGGTARLKVFGNGSMDISAHGAPGMAIGSVEGSGLIFLGDNRLTVGRNNLSTSYSGVIQDGGGDGGTGGSLIKTGMGTLTLDDANTYTGGTTISKGRLMVQNKTGSATGTGAVQVNAGTLGGKGTIAGAVTVGTGSGHGAFLSPAGKNGAAVGTLSVEGNLNLKADATYKFDLNSSNAKADQVVANGVSISGAQFSFTDRGSGTLATGTVFTVINNTAGTPIVGTFSNLLDGSIFTSNGNTYLVSYQGGDGNDLTLTVQ